jgi:hypothetical protein
MRMACQATTADELGAGARLLCGQTAEAAEGQESLVLRVRYNACSACAEGTTACCRGDEITHLRLSSAQQAIRSGYVATRHGAAVRAERGAQMVVVRPHGCGSEMQQQTVVACLLCSAAGSPPSKEVRPFGTIGTMTADLLRLVDWLGAGGGTHVAMKRTGVDGKPLCKRLEDRRAVLVVDAHHAKPCPAARRTGGTASGAPTCYGMNGCDRAAFPAVSSAWCAR